MKINKAQLRQILNKYEEIEKELSHLSVHHGMDFRDGSEMAENFYNKLNWIIFKLFEYSFGDEGREAIEEYLFDSTINFVQLCDILGINE
jgi:hypothetical protein